MKKLFLIVFVLLAGLTTGWHFFGERLLFRAVQKTAEANLNGSVLESMAGGLNVILCGAGSPLPDPTRAGPCTIIQAGDQMLAIDAGSGSPRNFGPMGLPGGEIDAVFLTHFHSDHMDGLGELMLQRWAGGGHAQALPVYGPPGVDAIVAGFNQAYALDVGYRVDHHGEPVLPRSGAGGEARVFPMPGPEGALVYSADGLKVTAFPVDHAPISPALGYRFDYQGRSVMLTGDTIATPTLDTFARGVDVMVSEALSPELVGLLATAARRAGNERIGTIMDDILDYHISPVQAAEIAQRAGAGYLLFTHIVPPLPVRLLEASFLKGVSEAYGGPVQVGRDGSWLHLPVGGDTIQSKSLMRY